MLDEINHNLGQKSTGDKQALVAASLPVLQKYLKKSKNIRFSGDNYSLEWQKEAKRKNLPNLPNSIEAFEALKSQKTVKAFTGILTAQELQSRYEIQCELFTHMINIEASVALDMFRTQILPAAMKHQKMAAKSLKIYHEVAGKKGGGEQLKLLKELNAIIDTSIKLANELEKEKDKAANQPAKDKGKAYSEKVKPKCKELRKSVDQLELIVDDTLWPLPKYRELLFMV